MLLVRASVCGPLVYLPFQKVIFILPLSQLVDTALITKHSVSLVLFLRLR